MSTSSVDWEARCVTAERELEALRGKLEGARGALEAQMEQNARLLKQLRGVTGNFLRDTPMEK